MPCLHLICYNLQGFFFLAKMSEAGIIQSVKDIYFIPSTLYSKNNNNDNYYTYYTLLHNNAVKIKKNPEIQTFIYWFCSFMFIVMLISDITGILL